MVENKPTPRKPRSSTGARPPGGTSGPVEGGAPTPPDEVPVIDEPAESIAQDIAADETADPVEPSAPGENDTEPIVGTTAVLETAGSVNDTAPIVVAVPTEPSAEPAPDRADLVARLAALEAENAALRAAAAAAPTAAAATAAGPTAARRRRKPGRTAAAIVLILVGALLAPVAVVGKWARDLVVDTDAYVATVAPIASDPGVQAAVSNRVTNAVVEALNVDQLATQVGDALGTLDLPPIVATGIQSLKGPLKDAVTGFVHKQVDKIVTSDAFAATWTAANRTAHEQIVATLRGDPDALGQISDSGQLVIDITPIIEQVKQSLVDAGFQLAGKIPTVKVTFPVASSADFVRLQNAYNAVDIGGRALPWISLLLLAAGVLVAQRRSRALVIAGLSLAGAMALLAVGLAIGRWFYTNSLPPSVQRPDVAVTIYDQVITLLRVELRVFLVLGLVVAIIAFLAGGTPAARSVRETSGRGAAWVRGLGDRHGVGTGGFGAWLYQQRTLIRVVVIALAVLVLVLADGLTGKIVFTVALVAVLVVGVVTLLARPPQEEPVTEPVPTT
ncbi:hypothetical protein [Cellulomonas sp. URHD0024]|uniref:hypothetical protein n=1 Tax=Cellulomonas sp. URHD0024 TaxID=1302620 RepID=UPI00041F0432|nr:hypothetical protein [Cellulomonas sp. URHD0024]